MTINECARLIVALILSAPCLFGQYHPPLTCKPGDLIDGYDGGFVCVAPDVWKDREHANFGTQDEWRPDCQWAFKDSAKSWHCPYETASGRAVGFVPCKDTLGVGEKGSIYDHSRPHYDNRPDCQKFTSEAEKRIELMQTGQTVQAEEEKGAQVIDHPKPHNYTCPEYFDLVVLREFNSAFVEDEVICWRKNAPEN